MFEKDEAKIILPARRILSGSKVTKVTGQKEYTLRNSIEIHEVGKERKTIFAEDGTQFLCDVDGNINVISGDTVLIWNTTYEECFHFLRMMMDDGV